MAVNKYLVDSFITWHACAYHWTISEIEIFILNVIFSYLSLVEILALLYSGIVIFLNLCLLYFHVADTL